MRSRKLTQLENHSVTPHSGPFNSQTWFNIYKVSTNQPLSQNLLCWTQTGSKICLNTFADNDKHTRTLHKAVFSVAGGLHAFYTY